MALPLEIFDSLLLHAELMLRLRDVLAVPLLKFLEALPQHLQLIVLLDELVPHFGLNFFLVFLDFLLSLLSFLAESQLLFLLLSLKESLEVSK